MNKQITSIALITAIILMGNWGGRRVSQVSGDVLHRINFFGKLVPYANQDKTIEVDNISIGNNIKQIPVFVAPTTKTNNIDPNLHTIKSNPKDILQQMRFDLSEVQRLETKRDGANSPIIWKYMDGDKTKREYIELVAASHDKTKNNYLIENRTLLRYNEKSPGGFPVEGKLNFKGVLKLTIEGYKDREMEKRKTRAKTEKKAKKTRKEKKKEKAAAAKKQKKEAPQKKSKQPGKKTIQKIKRTKKPSRAIAP